MRRTSGFILAALIVAISAGTRVIGGAVQLKPPSVIGRWDLIVNDPAGSFPSWLEVQQSGDRALVGRFVGRVGSARPISKVEFTDNVLHFSIPPQWEPGNNDLRVDGTLNGNQLTGWITDPAGNRHSWVGNRAPALRRSAPPVWATPITLFNGTDTSEWQPSAESQWRAIGGLLTNSRAGANLVSRKTFTDFKLHVEFRYPKDGNSGVYLRGRYEVQIEDSAELEPVSERLGALYGSYLPTIMSGKNQVTGRPSTSH